jgi:hypothetical protein
MKEGRERGGKKNMPPECVKFKKSYIIIIRTSFRCLLSVIHENNQNL